MQWKYFIVSGIIHIQRITNKKLVLFINVKFSENQSYKRLLLLMIALVSKDNLIIVEIKVSDP